MVKNSLAVFTADYFSSEQIYNRKIYTVSFYTAENLWKAIHRGNKEDGEQRLWNYAMQDLGVRWNVTTNSTDLCDIQTGWQSYEPVASIVFPQSTFCQRCCPAEHSNEYYLIHLNCPHKYLSRKAQQLKERNSWFLLDDWKGSVDSTVEGNSWLMSIYNT